MKYLFSIIFIIYLKSSCAQLTITNGASPASLVATLLGGGVTASNVTFQGVFNSSAVYQVGAFSAVGTVSTNLGMNNGVVMCTGKTSDIPLALATFPGSSNFSSSGLTSTCSNGEIRQGGSCPVYINDVDILAGAQNYYNAAVLEFDFIPNNTNVSFNYVFGSEEYDQTGSFAINYNCSTYNDKFGFIISGTGIAGGQGYTADGRNIAVLSNGSQVSINSVNDGVVGASGGSPSAANCSSANPAWINNSPSSDFKGAINGIQFNGNTKVLTASQSGLIAGSTYHIKLIVTDVNDGAYDSGVFLQAGSFSSPTILPITLLGFNGNCKNNGIDLTWQTASETNNELFTIERSIDGINFIAIGQINGSVSTSTIKSYYFSDANPISGINYYRLKQKDLDGTLTVHNIISVDTPCNDINSVNEISIYPNPINSSFTLDLNLNVISEIGIIITNSLGQEIKTISNKSFEKGLQLISIDTENFSSGIYLVKTIINNKIITNKIIKL